MDNTLENNRFTNLEWRVLVRISLLSEPATIEKLSTCCLLHGDESVGDIQVAVINMTQRQLLQYDSKLATWSVTDKGLRTINALSPTNPSREERMRLNAPMLPKE